MHIDSCSFTLLPLNWNPEPCCIRQHFLENPFFSDSVLQKKVEFAEDGGSTVTGAQVHWKEGKVSLEHKEEEAWAVRP